MRAITTSRAIGAPQADIWAVLADFANIANWNGGVKKSFATSEIPPGPGAQRHCDLAPFGELEETVSEWRPNEQMKVSIDSASKLPLKRALATFDLVAAPGADTTDVTVTYEYEPGWGIVGRAMSPILDRQFVKGFDGFLVDLEAAASAPA